MIINLFSIFNPSNSFNISINWISSLLIFIFFPIKFWLSPSRPIILIKKLYSYINSELENNISFSTKKIIILLFLLFLIILRNNLLGLFPYIFTRTSHLRLSLTLSIPCWLSLILYGWLFKTKHIFEHLVPINTPLALASFIVLIETTRNFIRPLTLAVRLSANIIAGHLLLSLLREISETINLLFLISWPFLTILIILEFAVAFIQRYVFITLISLYITEIN